MKNILRNMNENRNYILSKRNDICLRCYFTKLINHIKLINHTKCMLYDLLVVAQVVEF